VDPGGVEKKRIALEAKPESEGGHENENESDVQGPIVVAYQGRFI
jgi:hypothetical protein